MKIIDKFTLKIFSFIMLIISIVLFMISIQILQESIFGVLISRLFTLVTAGRTILVIVSIILFLLFSATEKSLTVANGALIIIDFEGSKFPLNDTAVTSDQLKPDNAFNSWNV